MEPYRLNLRQGEHLPKNLFQRKKDLLTLKDELREEIQGLGEDLKVVSKGAFNGKKWWALASEYLPDDLRDCFHCPISYVKHGKEFQVKGEAGKPDYLWRRWIAGLDEGYYKGHRTLSDAQIEIWLLPKNNRLKLARDWEEEHIRSPLQESLAESLRLYKEADEELRSLRRARDIEQLRGVRVIGCTTTGASINRALLDEVAPEIVIVEEAAEILEAHVLTCVGEACERLIMIGDHKQLRPKIDQHRLSVESGLGYDLNRSLFERLAIGGFPVSALGTQHRMRPELSAIVRAMTYPELKARSSRACRTRFEASSARSSSSTTHAQRRATVTGPSSRPTSTRPRWSPA